ncbi:MAG: hypothetical protein HOQ29_03460 [Acidobacteria bacterium]|nr:hypothetical protein [Acidobacteriota bacterium]
MADTGSKQHDDGRGVPASGQGSTAEPSRPDGRLLPGGSMEDAARAVGMNAVDREMLPSEGKTPEQVDYRDTPDEPPPTRPAAPR